MSPSKIILPFHSLRGAQARAAGRAAGALAGEGFDELGFSDRAQVRRPLGSIALAALEVDGGDDPVAAGDPAIVFGPGEQGEPTARDWADYCGTIDYEIVTRIGPRVPRRHVGEAIP